MSSRAGYWLAPLPVLLGLAIALWVGMRTMAEIGNAFSRLVAPGTAVVAFAKPGSYTIFHETEGVVDGRVYVAQNIPGMKVEVAPEAGGAEVLVHPPRMHSAYTIGGSTGEAMLEFTIAEPGRYRVTATYPAGQDGPKTVLAISRGILGSIFRAVGIVLGSVTLGFALSLALLLTTYFRRRRLSRAGAV